MYWNGQDGYYVTNIKMGHSEVGMKACVMDLITHMQANKFHVVDLFLQNKAPGVYIHLFGDNFILNKALNYAQEVDIYC